MPGSNSYKSLATHRYLDLARSLDYLQTRPDLDSSRVAYLGVSMGAAEGVVDATLMQDRLKTVVFLDGGFFLWPAAVGSDQVDFAPRMKKPVLMVNGRYDFSHDVTSAKPELVKEVLGWLDKYLGRVE